MEPFVQLIEATCTSQSALSIGTLYEWPTIRDSDTRSRLVRSVHLSNLHIRFVYCPTNVNYSRYCPNEKVLHNNSYLWVQHYYQHSSRQCLRAFHMNMHAFIMHMIELTNTLTHGNVNNQIAERKRIETVLECNDRRGVQLYYTYARVFAC